MALLLAVFAIVGCGGTGSRGEGSGPSDAARPPTKADASMDASRDSTAASHPDATTDAGADAADAPSSADAGADRSGDARTVSLDAAIDAVRASDAGADAAPAGDSGIDPFEYYDAGAPIVAVTDSDGWSVLPGMPGTDGGYERAIYVDSVGGSDSNTGASATSALQGIGTSSKLQSELQSAPAGQSIVVLLKPGSSWTVSPADQMNPPIGGTSAFPLLITGSRWPGTSGTPRARIGGMVYLGHSHIAVEGLQIGPGTSSGFNEGIHIPSGGETDFLIEDNVITGYIDLIEATGSQTNPIENLRVRRNYLFGACGGGAVVAFDGQDIAGALFEENFFDWNGAVSGECSYADGGLVPPYSNPNQNPLAHDIYFADDGLRVVALNVTFRRNLFARTLQSVKGAYTGVMDDNLFYDYLNGGFVGTWGSKFTNNVLVNGGGFGTALDNGHSPNEIASRKTEFCNNLHYNEGSPYTAGDYAFTSQNAAGVDLVFKGNVIDGFDRAFEFEDPSCFGYAVTDNLVQSNSFYEIQNPWPIANCPASFSGNRYHSPAGDTSAGSSGYGLERPGPVYSDVAAMEAFLGEDGGTYESSPFAFVAPSRNIASYLETTSPPLAAMSSNPTLLSYLALVRAQSLTARAWNPQLGVSSINAYLRAGHSVTNGKTLAYVDGGCP